MAVTNCKDCGHQISTEATVCPSCGAPIRRTSFVTKAVAWLIVATVAVAYCSRPAPSEPPQGKVGTYERCPDVVPAALWLPAGHEAARDDFTAKAYLLNTQGKCVLDGSYGESTRKYYYSVRPLGEKNAKHLRFTRDELRPGR